MPHGNNYTYWPDGTLGRAPSDGTVFVHHRDNSVWMWDDFKKHWYRSVGAGGFSPGEPEIELTKTTETKCEPTCECGSKFINSNRHTNWCPLYSEDQ